MSSFWDVWYDPCPCGYACELMRRAQRGQEQIAYIERHAFAPLRGIEVAR